MKMFQYQPTEAEKEALIEQVRTMLDKYSWVNTHAGVEKLVDTFYRRKNESGLLTIFTLSKDYIGNYRIVKRFQHKREFDYALVRALAMQGADFAEIFNGYPTTKAAKIVLCVIACLNITDMEVLNAEKADTYNHLFSSNFPEERFSVRNGQPFTKAIGKALQTLGGVHFEESVYGEETAAKLNKMWKRLEAQIGDCRSGNKDYVGVLSLHPCDILGQSFGNTWSSCHTIDRMNYRKIKVTSSTSSNYGGMHASGPLSYAVDSNTMQFSVYSPEAYKEFKDGEMPLEEVPKTYRMTLSMQDDVLLQSRIYPQGNDGATDLYGEFRHICQSIISECLGVNPDDWVVNGHNTRAGSFTNYNGTVYPDAQNYAGPTISYMKFAGRRNFATVRIGDKPICPNCGREHMMDSFLLCGSCAERYYIYNAEDADGSSRLDIHAFKDYNNRRHVGTKCGHLIGKTNVRTSNFVCDECKGGEQ